MPSEHRLASERALSAATSFLLRWLSLQGRLLLTMPYVVISAVVGLCLLWFQQQDVGVQVLGYIFFGLSVVILAVVASAYPRWVGVMFDLRFGGFPPLILALLNFKPGDELDMGRLLSYGGDLVTKALRQEGAALSAPDGLVVSLGGTEEREPFVSKKRFYSSVDDFFAVFRRDSAWATGEFGILRDERFLSELESSQAHAKIVGYIEGYPDDLSLALERLSVMDSESPRPTSYAIEKSEHAWIKRLVEDGRLSLWVSPRRFEIPHCAIMGEVIYLQQAHIHAPGPDQAPVVTLMLRNPSESLRKFVAMSLAEQLKVSKRLAYIVELHAN